jgi:hypothetical protein
MEKVLVLSYAFNMDGRAASLTITDKLPALVDRGWEPVVLSGILGKKDTTYEHHELVCWGPSGLRFDFRHWFALRFGRGLAYKLVTGLVSFLLLPAIAIERLVFGWSGSWSWTLPAVFWGTLRMQRRDISLIYSTGGSWCAHLAGWLLAAISGKPWIAELHDPLVDRYDDNDEGITRRKSADARMRQKLEKLICKNATCAWWFTEAALAKARHRNPGIGNRGFYVLPGAKPHEVRKAYQRGDLLRFAHFGSLDISRSLANFLKAMKIFVDSTPACHGKLLLDIYGAPLDASTRAILDQEHLHAFVRANGRLEYDPTSGLTGRQRVHQEMQTSDVLLLIHGNSPFCEEYIPSKFYDYLWAQRPILAITHRNQQLDKLVEDYHGWHVPEGDTEQLLKTISEVWLRWQRDELHLPYREPIDVTNAADKIISHVSMIRGINTGRSPHPESGSR